MAEAGVPDKRGSARLAVIENNAALSWLFMVFSGGGTIEG